jgi:hypothetical protein
MRSLTLQPHQECRAPSAGQAGVMALLLLTCWGAWVLLIGFQPCALSYLLWR